MSRRRNRTRITTKLVDRQLERGEVITSFLTLLSPVGGETAYYNEAYNITWNCTGLLTVKIEFSDDNGATWATLEEELTASLKTYSWTVGDYDSDNCLIRLSSGTLTSQSATVFSVKKQYIVITSPNGSEAWIVASSHDITWNANDITGAAVLYYNKSDGEWIKIDDVADVTTETYAWTIPDDRSTEVKVKIVAGDYNDESDAYLSITNPTLTITYPTSSDTLYRTNLHNITWTAQDVSTIKIQYKTMGWGNLTGATGIDASLGTWQWEVDKVAGANKQLKIVDESNASVYDDSELFTIANPTVTVTKPTESEEVIKGSTYTIEWTHVGMRKLKIYVSTDGENYELLLDEIEADDLAYEWTVSQSASATCYIRLTNYYNETFKDESAVFSIVQPSVAITSPNGGEDWFIGNEENITWSANYIEGTATLYYNKSGGEDIKIDDIEDVTSETYAWTIPNDASFEVKVKIVCGDYNDQSNSNFTIEAPYITLTAPDGGEEWVSGASENITWISAGITGNVTLAYSTNNGSSYTDIATVAYDSSPYSWTVPAAISSTCLVKVYQGAVNDISAGTFTISLPVTMLTKFYYDSGADTFTCIDEKSTGRAITMESTYGGSTIYHRMVNGYKGTNNADRMNGGNGSNFPIISIANADSSDCQPSATGFTVWWYATQTKANNYETVFLQKIGGDPIYGWKLGMKWDRGKKGYFTVTINGTAYTATTAAISVVAGADPGLVYMLKGEYNQSAGTVTVTWYKVSDLSTVTATTSSVPANDTWSTESLQLCIGSSNNEVWNECIGCYAGLLTAGEWTSILTYMRDRKTKDTRPTFLTNLMVFETDGGSNVQCRDIITSEVLTRVAANESQISLTNGWNGSNNCALIASTASPPTANMRYFEMADQLPKTTGRTVVIMGKKGYHEAGGFGPGLYEASNGGWSLELQARYHAWYVKHYTAGYSYELNTSGKWELIAGTYNDSTNRVDLYCRALRMDEAYWQQGNNGSASGTGDETDPQPRTPGIFQRNAGYVVQSYYMFIAYAPDPKTIRQIESVFNYLEKYYVTE